MIKAVLIEINKAVVSMKKKNNQLKDWMLADVQDCHKVYNIQLYFSLFFQMIFYF
jgi:hypothetical protein